MPDLVGNLKDRGSYVTAMIMCQFNYTENSSNIIIISSDIENAAIFSLHIVFHG